MMCDFLSFRNPPFFQIWRFGNSGFLIFSSEPHSRLREGGDHQGGGGPWRTGPWATLGLLSGSGLMASVHTRWRITDFGKSQAAGTLSETVEEPTNRKEAGTAVGADWSPKGLIGIVCSGSISVPRNCHSAALGTPNGVLDAAKSARICQIGAELGRHRHKIELGPRSAEDGPLWPIPGRTCSSSTLIRPIPGQAWPNSKDGPMSSSTVGRTRFDLGRSSAEFDQRCPTLGQHWPTSGQGWPKLAAIWCQHWSLVWPTLGKLGEAREGPAHGCPAVPGAKAAVFSRPCRDLQICCLHVGAGVSCVLPLRLAGRSQQLRTCQASPHRSVNPSADSLAALSPHLDASQRQRSAEGPWDQSTLGSSARAVDAHVAPSLY